MLALFKVLTIGIAQYLMTLQVSGTISTGGLFMVDVKKLLAKALDENCYVIEEEEVLTIIDPGYGLSEEFTKLVSDKQVRILLTHGHADHTHDADQIAASAIIIHELDRPLLLDPSKSFLTFFGKTRLLIEEGLIVTPEILHRPWKCLHTPGHTKGSCCFMYGERYLFSGDTVFSNSVGRTDLPDGDGIEMERSLRKLKQFFIERPDLIVLPGHGPETTAQSILRENPFFT